MKNHLFPTIEQVREAPGLATGISVGSTEQQGGLSPVYQTNIHFGEDPERPGNVVATVYGNTHSQAESRALAEALVARYNFFVNHDRIGGTCPSLGRGAGDILDRLILSKGKILLADVVMELIAVRNVTAQMADKLDMLVRFADEEVTETENLGGQDSAKKERVVEARHAYLLYHDMDTPPPPPFDDPGDDNPRE